MSAYTAIAEIVGNMSIDDYALVTPGDLSAWTATVTVDKYSSPVEVQYRQSIDAGGETVIVCVPEQDREVSDVVVAVLREFIEEHQGRLEIADQEIFEDLRGDAFGDIIVSVFPDLS